jgi:AraC family transcriptional regulator, glycine betaine-responsive activator
MIGGMRHRFAVLVLPGFSNMVLAAVIEPLRAANRAANRTLYTWTLLSEDGAEVPSSSGLHLRPDHALAAAPSFDALFVVASYGAERHATARVLRALRGAARRRALLGGLETGAYVLALAGVLDRHRATTHWEDIDDMAERFPAVTVVRDRFVVDRDRVTSGGAIPTLDLMLALLQREHGAALAFAVAGAFIYDAAHAGGEPQPMRAVGGLATRDPKLVQAIRLMEQHIEVPLPVAALARAAGVGPRELHRRFHAQLGTSPSAYYAELRLFLARRLLEHTDHPVSRVAVMSGFGSGSAFARAFRARFGVAPSSVRRAG